MTAEASRLRRILTRVFPDGVYFQIGNISKPPDQTVGRVFGGIDAGLLGDRLQKILCFHIGIILHGVVRNDDILLFCSIIGPFANAAGIWLGDVDVLATFRRVISRSAMNSECCGCVYSKHIVEIPIG